MELRAAGDPHLPGVVAVPTTCRLKPRSGNWPAPASADGRIRLKPIDIQFEQTS